MAVLNLILILNMTLTRSLTLTSTLTPTTTLVILQLAKHQQGEKVTCNSLVFADVYVYRDSMR